MAHPDSLRNQVFDALTDTLLGLLAFLGDAHGLPSDDVQITMTFAAA